MSHSQIDEVRELFTSDMNRFLGDLEVRSRELGTEVAAIRDRTQGVARAQSGLVVSFHAIAGTSALLSISSSQSVAGRLENMMQGLQSAVHTVIAEGERMRRMQRACEVAISSLRAIIEAELAGDSAQANRRAAAAMRQVTEVTEEGATAGDNAGERAAAASPGQPPIPPVPAAPTGDSAAADPEHAELLAVFREELSGALAEARAQLAELELGGQRDSALSRLGAILHMMKGSAASVREDALAIELRAIYEVVEDYLDRGELPDAAALRRLRADLAACAPEPEDGVDAGWDAQGEQDPQEEAEGVDAVELFRGEAAELLQQARARLEELAREPEAVREDLGRILHRIKGSALVVGLADVGTYAAELERLARGGGPVPELSHLARLQAMLEVRLAPNAPIEPAPRAKVTRHAVPDRVTGELWESFVEEAGELIEAIERGARELETTTGDTAVVALLGTIHTLKGAANTVGLSPVGRELHVVETILEVLRANPSAKRRSFVLARLFDVVERLRRNLRAATRGEVECAAEVLDGDLARLVAMDATSAEAPSGHSWLSAHDSAWSQPVPGPAMPGSSREHTGEPSAESGSAGTGRSAKISGGQERRFIRVPAERLDALMDLVGELIVARSRVDSGLAHLAELQASQEARRHSLLGIVDAFTEQAEYANLGGVARRQRRGNRAPVEFGALEFDVYEEVHVLARRLAEASSDVGETSAAISSGLGDLGDSIEELGGIVSGLQGQINRARMVPLEALFSRLALPARDAAERERKQVEVSFEGAQVVVDKVIADALYAPMLHLVRNAVAHGIESSSGRRAAGKPERGTITLSARQEAGEIVIAVRDDGAGLRREALHREGIALGLISPQVPLEAPEVLELVFSAGLSTSTGATDVAGRGVGGDVVRRTVHRLGGSVRVTSEPGRGATFLLRLPVTLAITRAAIIRQGNLLLAIPLPFVERILRHDEVQEVAGNQGRRVRFGEDLLSVFRVVDGARRDAIVLICSVGGRRLAVEADAVLAQDEIVVKKLGPVLDGHPMFAGALQRGDGELALVLDMHGVAETHTQLLREAKPARKASEAAEPARPAAPGPAATPAAPAEVVVLFVDDSLSVRKVAEATLKKLGVKVVTASDGRDALDRLRDQPVSIVLTDLEMPRMHGYELIAEMRYIAAYKDIPIVVVSSRSGDKHVQKALEAGANEYLTKPFSPETLRGALERLVPALRGGGGNGR